MKSRITVEYARKILNKDGIKYTDEEIEEIIVTLEKLAHITIEHIENTTRVKKIFSDGLSIEDAKKQLAIEGLHYDTKALTLIKEDMLQSEVSEKS
jgi:hypothetical protein